MGRPKKVKRLWGTLKDKASLLKLLLSRRRTPTSTLRLAVLKATSHDPSTSPPPHFLSDLILLSHRSSASHAAADALLSRLRNTRDPFVALKCLLALHHLLPALHGAATGPLSLSTSLHHSDPDTWQLSLWARWFAQEIEHTLSDSLPSVSATTRLVSGLSNSGLLRELRELVSMVEQLGSAPDSLHYQTIGVIYEVVKSAGEDYRITMREIFARIREIEHGERLERFNGDELNELVGLLERLEGCEEKMLLMFLNKKRNDGVWDAIREAKAKAADEKRRRDNSKVVAVVERAGWARETRARRWLDVEWNWDLTVSTA